MPKTGTAVNIRLPDYHVAELNDLCRLLGVHQADILTFAITVLGDDFRRRCGVEATADVTTALPIRVVDAAQRSLRARVLNADR